jgi:hypothetical protein
LIDMTYYTFLTKPIDTQKTFHYGGSLTNYKLMPVPDILILEDEGNRAFLYRYTLKGEFVGDTWHPTVDEARQQATYEYEDSLGEWKEMPPHIDTTDYFAYILEQRKTN